MALADPLRRHLLDRLSRLGSASATTLAEQLPVTRQAVAKHLVVLDRAGLVAGGRHGREVRYVVRPEALRATADWLRRVAVDWEGRLAAGRRPEEITGSR